MPKNEKEKNSKSSKSKTSTQKKTNVKKVEEKKVNKEKTTTDVKKVEEKKVNKEKTPIETKNSQKEEKPIERKKTSDRIIDRIMDDKPLVVSICLIVVLIGVIICVASLKRSPKLSDGEEVIASLNGKNITANDLYESLKESSGTDALIDLIDKYISNKEVTITDDDKSYANEVVDYYKKYADSSSVDFETFLTSYLAIPGVTNEDEFYNYVLEDYKKTLAITKFIGDEAKEEDLKKYYDDNYSETIKVRHILIEIDDEAEDQEKADKEAYDKAANLIKELDNTSTKELEDKFSELAKDNSDDTATYAEGGLYDAKKSDTVEEFYTAAKKLKDSEYTKEPVKTEYGYHVILRISSTQAEKYDDIKDEVKKAYAENLLQSDDTLFAKKWDELRNKYKLSINDDYIKDSYNKAIDKVLNSTEE